MLTASDLRFRYFGSGSRGLLPAPSPLRTLRDSFPSQGSSLLEEHPCGVLRSKITTSRYLITVRITRLPSECTSCPNGRHHLHSLLSSDSIIFYVIRDLPNVSPPYGADPISTSILTITVRHSLLSARQSSPLSACLTVSLPKGQRHWVPTFRIVDHLSDLSVPSTPVVLQFRAGS